MIVVIGGGAAGMMAAIAAAEGGARVILLERNRFCGVKLNITGKGRCNVTNDASLQALMDHMTRNGKFLYSAFFSWSSRDTMSFFEELGVPLKVERGNRVFPVSDRAKDITEALKNRMRALGVRVENGRAARIRTEDGAVRAVELENGRTLPASAVIVATGGRSYPRTGSDGDGYRLAQELGHQVLDQRPSLVPLLVAGDLPRRLEGLSLRNVRLTVTKGNKELYSDFGEMLFTADGLSGPLVLSASAHLGRGDDFPYRAEIDLKPALTADMLDKRLLRDFAEQHNRDFSNVLAGLLPAKLQPVMVELSGIPAQEKVHSVTRAQREGLTSLLKALPLELTGFGSWHEAVVTSGGVDVRQVSPKTMGSKLVKGLYFAGEVLDVDAYTGGFNLQIAWSTGRAAGRAAAEEERL